MFNELILAQISVLDGGIYLIIGSVISVVRKKASTRVFVEAIYAKPYMFRLLVRRSSIFLELLIDSSFDLPLISSSNFFCSIDSFLFWLSHSLLNSDLLNTSCLNCLNTEVF